MVYWITTLILDRDGGGLLCVGAAGAVFVRLDAVGPARARGAAPGGLRNWALYQDRDVRDHRSSFLSLSSQLVLVSGAMELAGAVGLLLPQFTRTASLCLAVLMIAIFPANVYAAGEVVGGLHMPSVPVRLAMQVVYILLLLIAGWGVRGKTA